MNFYGGKGRFLKGGWLSDLFQHFAVLLQNEESFENKFFYYFF
jgi:hypothetical protein